MFAEKEQKLNQLKIQTWSIMVAMKYNGLFPLLFTVSYF